MRITGFSPSAHPLRSRWGLNRTSCCGYILTVTVLQRYTRQGARKKKKQLLKGKGSNIWWTDPGFMAHINTDCLSTRLFFFFLCLSHHLFFPVSYVLLLSVPFTICLPPCFLPTFLPPLRFFASHFFFVRVVCLSFSHSFLFSTHICLHQFHVLLWINENAAKDWQKMNMSMS